MPQGYPECGHLVYTLAVLGGDWLAEWLSSGSEWMDRIDELREIIGQASPPQVGADAVNAPMIRHWCDAMEDDLPAYTDAVGLRRPLATESSWRPPRC